MLMGKRDKYLTLTLILVRGIEGLGIFSVVHIAGVIRTAEMAYPGYREFDRRKMSGSAIPSGSIQSGNLLYWQKVRQIRIV